MTGHGRCVVAKLPLPTHVDPGKKPAQRPFLFAKMCAARPATNAVARPGRGRRGGSKRAER
eukprot:10136417-Lingulodinium_polyedra.AAC.1